MADNGNRESIVEALIMASPEPLPARKIVEVAEEMTPSRVGQAVAGLNERYQSSGSCYRIREVAGGYQFYIVPEYAGYVDEMFSRRRKMRLTRAALETLAIIAYRQPVTKTDIEYIRGVASDGVLHNLLEKNVIKITGRAETIGRPLQYGTTDEFLKFFGLNRLEDLPSMSEIEELMAAAAPQFQTELHLDGTNSEPGETLRLNIGDGTDDPRHADEVDIIIGDPDPESRGDSGCVLRESDGSESAANGPDNGNGGKGDGAVVDMDPPGRTS